MKIAIFTIVLGTVFVSSSIAEPAPSTEREWTRHLSPSDFHMGTARVQVEKRLAARKLGEEDSDHGFDILRDAYYELDSRWCAVASYVRSTGALAVQPRLIPNTPELRERLTKLAQPAK